MKMINQPMEKDQVHLMAKNLLPTYYKKLYYLSIATFEQLYNVEV